MPTATSGRIGYLELLRPSGRKAMALTGAVSRFPLTGAGVAIVLAVGTATGSYALAGTASATYVVLAALSAPVLARLMDQLGQRRVLAVAAAVQALALTGLALAITRAPNPFLLVALCGVVGLVAADIGSAVRSRWAALLSDGEGRRTAFVLESVVDETMFVITPLLVTVAAALVHPVVGLLVIGVGPALGWTALALQTRTAPPVVGRTSAKRPPMPPATRAGLVRLGLAFLSIGAYLGSIEMLLVALANRVGRPAEAGVALAGWAIGSAGAALILGLRIGSTSPGRVLVAGGAVMAAFGLLLPAGHGVLWLTAVCFFAGIGASPALSAGFGLASDVAGGERRTEGLTWMSTGMGFGTTVGAFTGGLVADRVPDQSAYLLCSAFGLIALCAVVWVARTTRPVAATGDHDILLAARNADRLLRLRPRLAR